MDAERGAPSLASARDRVLERIAAACARSGRSAEAVSLVAVSKTVPAERLRAAVAAGLTLLGENRVQEADAKVPLVGGARWELIGPLQSNKARSAVALFDRIETVADLTLAERLARIAGEVRPGRPLPVLLQVNVDEDPAKAGFDPRSLESELPAILGLAGLRVDGLMTIGRRMVEGTEARATFRRLRELGERLRRGEPRLGQELSMGMSDDFELAVEEGATIVRVGRAIFGERPGST